MKLDHLTNDELIKYVLRFDNDPIRIRLASIMENMTGWIVEGLEDAGMSKESFLFENTYDPGQFIRHLEGEIEYLNRELDEVQGELEKRKTLTVAGLIEELVTENHRLEFNANEAIRLRRQADKEVEDTRAKMKVWRALSTDVS
jgi:hypothetical protein